MSSRPAIRLRPKTDPRPIRRGFPWVYDNQLVTDRRTRALEPGSIAVLLGAATGRDGIGGASVLASASFDEESGTLLGVSDSARKRHREYRGP